MTEIDLHIIARMADYMRDHLIRGDDLAPPCSL
eukprot:COSAG05_NODE_10846_length_542_cov_1.616253_2_plen_32_part_01